MNKSNVIFNEAQFLQYMWDTAKWNKGWKPPQWDGSALPSSSDYPLVICTENVTTYYGREDISYEWVTLADFGNAGAKVYQVDRTIKIPELNGGFTEVTANLGTFTSISEANREIKIDIENELDSYNIKEIELDKPTYRD